MAIEWTDRNEALPDYGISVLAWGFVPCVPGIDAALRGCFLGMTMRRGDEFGLDGTGHCGGTKVTHWAYISAPKKTVHGSD